MYRVQGQRFHTGEHVCAQRSDGLVIRSGSVRETGEPITLDILKGVIGRPCAPSGYDATSGDVVRPSMSEEAVPVFVPRRLYVTQEMISKFGMTAGCVKCGAMISGRGDTRPHTEECRNRMTELLKEDPQMKAKLEDKDERRNMILRDGSC